VSPVLEMLDAGIPIALGSDSVASNNRMDMLAEGRAAILAQRARRGSHDALCSKDALHLATLGGARALGIDRDVGSLDLGKSADLAAFPLDACAIPVHDPEAAAIFALPGTNASLVTVAGRELVRNGRLVQRDEELPHRVEVIGARMREWARASG
jgi:5-methylthioadenosine/S-adenosylhomocysteine deaminase